ncbi:hypothetical protein P9112_007677 [Eukaryota sp. TZLM1-RC]
MNLALPLSRIILHSLPDSIADMDIVFSSICNSSLLCVPLPTTSLFSHLLTHWPRLVLKELANTLHGSLSSSNSSGDLAIVIAHLLGKLEVAGNFPLGNSQIRSILSILLTVGSNFGDLYLSRVWHSGGRSLFFSFLPLEINQAFVLHQFRSVGVELVQNVSKFQNFDALEQNFADEIFRLSNISSFHSLVLLIRSIYVKATNSLFKKGISIDLILLGFELQMEFLNENFSDDHHCIIAFKLSCHQILSDLNSDRFSSCSTLQSPNFQILTQHHFIAQCDLVSKLASTKDKPGRLSRLKNLFKSKSSDFDNFVYVDAVNRMNSFLNNVVFDNGNFNYQYDIDPLEKFLNVQKCSILALKLLKKAKLVNSKLFLAKTSFIKIGFAFGAIWLANDVYSALRDSKSISSSKSLYNVLFESIVFGNFSNSKGSSSILLGTRNACLGFGFGGLPGGLIGFGSGILFGFVDGSK